jgi:hypothetical protein
MSRTTNVKKPYCKVCQDAGKPEFEYTNHWVKDLSGKTTCPTLLSTECRYCFKLGHTAKFCNVLCKNNKEKDRAECRLRSIITEKPKPVVQKKHTNGFAALCDDSDSEEEVSNTSNEYPKMQAKKIEVELPKVKQEVKTGWAAIVAKPAEVKKVVDNSKPTGLVLLSDYIKPLQKLSPWTESKQPVVKKSWADESDEETDDESLPEVNFNQEIEDTTW